MPRDTTIIKQLNGIVAEVDSEISYINYGGCAVFASVVYPYLRKLGLAPRIRVVSHWEKPAVSIEQAREKSGNSKNTDAWYDAGVNFNHVLCEIRLEGKTYFLDSHGLKSSVAGHLYKGHLRLYEVKAFAGDAGAWNDTFNRRDIPKMAHLLDEGFKGGFPSVFPRQRRARHEKLTTA